MLTKGTTLNRVRGFAGLAICWVPFFAVVGAVILLWEYLFADIATQWMGEDVSTIAPAWTAFLPGFCGSVICAVLATVAAFDADGRGRRNAFFWTFGIAAMLTFVSVGVMTTNGVAIGQPVAPEWLLLSPLVILVGIIPWAIAGRGEPHAVGDQPAPVVE